MRTLGWFVIGWLAVLLFWHVDTWHTPNPTSRALLTIALVEDGQYSIDRFKDWTEDKALARGQHYSDKAPLSSWLAVPLYYAVTKIRGTTSERAKFPLHSAIYSGVVASGILPALAFAGLLWAALSRSGASPVLSVLYLFSALPGSMLGLYAGTFFGHLLGGLLLVLAWIHAFHRRSPLLSGLFAGMAGLAEFPLLFFAPFLFMGPLLIEPRRFGQTLGRFLVGVLPGALLIALHNTITTGSPWEFAYKHVASESFSHMKTHYGFRLPSLSAVQGLLFSQSRGLFLYVPLASVLIFFLLFRPRTLSRLLGVRLAAGLGFLLLVSSYQMWDGGWAFGPRHLIPLSMVLLYEGTSLVPKRCGRPWLWGLGLAASFGSLHVFLAKATKIFMVPQDLHSPLLELFVPTLLRGELNPNVLPTTFFGVSPLYAHLAWGILLTFGCLGLCVHALALEASSVQLAGPETPSA